MAAWFTVYCSRTVDHLTAADLMKALDGVDFPTVAEGFGIEDERTVERAVRYLRVVPAESDPSVWLRVRYRRADYRPLLVHLWSSPSRVREEAGVAREHLAGRREKVARGSGPLAHPLSRWPRSSWG